MSIKHKKIKFYASLTQILERELSHNKVMIVITGISGSGKSTVMKELQETVSDKDTNVFLSVDDFKVREYEKYGFCNGIEKEVLRDKAVNAFKAEIIINARDRRNIIVEYPFAAKWQPFFNYIHDEYGYRLVIVNCNSRDFEEIWRKKVDRDFITDKRHPALVSDMFFDKDNYSSNIECSDDFKNKLYGLYISNYYNSITGDIMYKESGWKEEYIIL